MQIKNRYSKRKKILSFDCENLEKMLSEILLRQGWKIYIFKLEQDGFVYIMATKKTALVKYLRFVFQVVNYNFLPVTVNIVRQLQFVVSKKKAHKGFVVSFDKLTPHAIKLFQNSNAFLDHVNVEDLIFMSNLLPQPDNLLF